VEQPSVHLLQKQAVERESRLRMGAWVFPVFQELTAELQSEVRVAMQVKQPIPPASWVPRPFDILTQESSSERAMQR
jgi:hypothetical protein